MAAGASTTAPIVSEADGCNFPQRQILQVREMAALFEHEGQRLVSTQTVRHDYLTLSGKVMRETVWNNDTLTDVMDFIYDESGRPFGMILLTRTIYMPSIEKKPALQIFSFRRKTTKFQ